MKIIRIINITKPSLPPLKEYIEEIKNLWDTQYLTNAGVKHNKLENELKKYLGIQNLTLFTNGHLSLESAIDSMNIKGEVITTPFTFASTTHAIIRKGLDPIFCDIDMSDLTIDTKKIEEKINEKTSAIMPVHIYGNICDIDSLEKIAKSYDIKIIYDAAHAFGITVNGKGIGNFGDASIFSFHATKVFNTIEGGAITFKDKNLKEKADALKNFGITGPESVEYIGGNAKMNEFQAAMGLCNLRYIDKEIEKRKLVTERYIYNLKEIDGIRIQSYKKGINYNYSYFPVILENYKYSRDDIYKKLLKNNILSRKYFYPLTKDLKCYGNRFKNINTPNAEYISNRVLTLPLYADLDFKDVDRICNIIKE